MLGSCFSLDIFLPDFDKLSFLLAKLRIKRDTLCFQAYCYLMQLVAFKIDFTCMSCLSMLSVVLQEELKQLRVQVASLKGNPQPGRVSFMT